MASLVNTTVTSAAGSAVALTAKGGNDIVDNILLDLKNNSDATVFNIRNSGALYGTAGTFSGNLTINTRLTFSGGSSQYLEIGTNSIALKNSSGNVLWNSSNQVPASGGTFTGTVKIQSTAPTIKLYDTNSDTDSVQVELNGGNFRFYKYTGSTDASHAEIFKLTTAGVVTLAGALTGTSGTFSAGLIATTISGTSGTFSSTVTSVDGLLSNYHQVYATGTTGFLIATNIVATTYGFIFGEIRLEQFNVSSHQTINFSCTVLPAGTVYSKEATADIAVTIKLFNYDGKWYIWVPSPSTFTTISAFVNLGAGYQGSTRGSNAITSVTAAAVPASGVTNSTDLVARQRIIANTSGQVFIGSATTTGGKLMVSSSDNTVYDASQASHQRDEGSTLMINNESTTAGSFSQLLLRNRSSNVGGCRIVSIDSGADDSELAIVTGDTNESMRILGDGNVGIGTTAPQGPLHVVGGNVNIDTTSGARWLTLDAPTLGGYLTFETDGTAFADIGTAKGITANAAYSATDLMINTRSGAKNIVFGINGVEKVRIDNNGKVGIGTTTPSLKFQVHSGDILITSGKQLISTNSYTQAPGGMLTIQGPSVGNTTLSSNQWGIMIGPQHTRSSVANTYYPGIAFNHLLNHSGATGYNNAPQAWIGTRLHDTPGSERAFLVFSTKAGTGVAASDVPLERMCIDPVHGSVGIGTTDPAYALDVRSSGATTLQVKSASNSDDTQLKLQSNNFFFNITNEGASGNITYVSDDAQDQIWYTDNASNSSVERFRIEGGADVDAVYFSNSNVGIGTNAPAVELHINDASGLSAIRLTGGAASADGFQIMQGVTGVTNAGFSIYDVDATATRLVIDTNGSVGIGTATPATPLHITKSAVGDNEVPEVVRLSTLNSASPSWSTTDGLCIGAEMKKADGTTITKQPIKFRYDGGDMATTLEDGKVGIGTNAPESLLHLQGSIPTIILHDTDTAVSGDDYGKIQWHTKDASMPGTDDIGAEIKATDDSTYGDRAALLFSTAHNATSLTERMRIASNGYVGIGTSGPVTLLDVYHATHSQITASAPAGHDSSLSLIEQSTAAAFGSASVYGFQWKYDGGDNKLYLSSGVDTNVVNRLTVQRDDGNVGIGTVSPAAHLHVSKASGATTVLTQVASNSTVGYEIKKTGTTTQHWKIVDGQTVNGVLEFYDATDSLTRMAIDGNGNVGINDSSPTYKLDVNGTGRFTGALTASTVTASDGGGFIGSGASLTGLNATNISSGTVAAARLGSGSSITTKFLRGDNTWQTVTSGGGSVTSVAVSVGTGMDVSGSPITSSGTISLSLDLSELTDMTADITTSDEVILLDSGAERRKAFGELKLSKFNNDSGWTSNTGDITAVTAGTALSGGGTSGSVTLNVANPFILGDNTDTYGIIGMAKVGYVGHGDYAAFAHRDVGTTTSYALLQDSVGSTFLNAANNKLISFRINNANVIAMDSTSLYSVTNNAEALGKTGNRWSNVYSVLGNFSGTVTGGTFSGSGASLTSLSATQLTSGTVPAARLGNVTVATTAADVLSTSNGAISADDAGADKLVYWDEGLGKLKYLTFSDLTALPA